MVNLNDLLNENGYNWDEIKDVLDNFWQKQGLKDEDLRKSYNATLSNEEANNLGVSAINLNIRANMLNERGGIFARRILKRCDDRFLEIINSGLDLNKPINFEDKKLNLLNQTIRMGDYNRLTLLLSAGAKICVDRDNPRKDSLTIAAHTHDIATMQLLLCYMDQPLNDHWLIGLLHSTSDPIDYVMGEMIARRSVRLGDKYEDLMQKSLDSFHSKFPPENTMSA